MCLYSVCPRIREKYLGKHRSLYNKTEASIQACDEVVHELEAQNKKFQGGSSRNRTAAARTMTRRITCPFRQSTVQKLEDVDESISHIRLALEILQQKDIGNIKNDTEDARSLLELVRSDQVSSAIRDCLRAPDASVEYNSNYKSGT